jgi:hypothetical protein
VVWQPVPWQLLGSRRSPPRAVARRGALARRIGAGLRCSLRTGRAAGLVMGPERRRSAAGEALHQHHIHTVTALEDRETVVGVDHGWRPDPRPRADHGPPPGPRAGPLRDRRPPPQATSAGAYMRKAAVAREVSADEPSPGLISTDPASRAGFCEISPPLADHAPEHAASRTATARKARSRRPRTLGRPESPTPGDAQPKGHLEGSRRGRLAQRM